MLELPKLILCILGMHLSSLEMLQNVTRDFTVNVV